MSPELSLSAPTSLPAPDVDRLRRAAREALQRGDFAAAIAHCQQIIKAHIDDAETYAIAAAALVKQGKLTAAEKAFEKALAANDNLAEAHRGLGNLLLQQGKHAAAIPWFQQAVAIQPDAIAYCNLGVAQLHLGNTTAALAAFQTARSLNPRLAQVAFNLGDLLFQQQRVPEAIPHLRAAIAMLPKYAKAYFSLGNALLTEKKKETVAEAILCFRKYLTFLPDNFQARFQLANALGAAAQWDEVTWQESLATYAQVLAVQPDFPEAHFNMGNLFLKQKQWEPAIACYEKAIACKPDYPKAFYNLGTALGEMECYDRGIATFRQAIALQPDYAEAYCNLGILLKQTTDRAQLEESIRCLRKAIALNDGLESAHYSLGIALLAIGEYEEGWREQEWRLRSATDDPLWQALAATGKPMWDGSAIADQTLLVRAEGGFGDVIQFCRFVPLLAERGARVILRCPETLAGLLADLPGVIQIVTPEDSLPDFDTYASILSLPALLGTTLEMLPQLPYLGRKKGKGKREKAESALLERSAGTKKIGIVWASGYREPRHLLRSYESRSCSPELFARLWEFPEVTLYSFQIGKNALKQSMLPTIALAEGHRDRLVDLSPAIANFSDTAALLESMDLVISVDTAVAHLAGALGKPVWTLLPAVADWRWLLDRTDSPWYPTMRLWRQRELGNWEEVFDRLIPALGVYLEGDLEADLHGWH